MLRLQTGISTVSINSTSEEVRSAQIDAQGAEDPCLKFPLIQLPRKSEVFFFQTIVGGVQPVSINSTSEEVRSLEPTTTEEE